ncbi:TPA: GPW/gp25 family protein [Salmonella bongori]|uniref:DNA replication/recombination/repair protein n=2 Tax=Salmonella bongori TaxID=54736 RepID=A0A8F8ARX9_SALBN|nr:GPW/gp25 family protein [Salmonella bongori]ECC8731380.1 DNA replication/recombination/repair protein [Salmonella bongori]ECE6546585.1 DNA replication/recombination/repair protein [Salmonella bongori]ECI3518436.1 DNA replication/recombination/repair protein [Salmonella bongori]EDP8575225.1 DNA replication/recombination/repair protein [Salmonella bongori]EDP8593070.1 DNA replication/recombination/repair protein [Salmonella bongori]
MRMPTLSVAQFDRLMVERINPHELVRQKLMYLFNSRASADGKTLPTLLTQGMPEWHGLNVGDTRVLNWFCRELRAAILCNEPEIKALRVKVKNVNHQTLALYLEAIIQDVSAPLKMEITYQNGRWRQLLPERTETD